MNQGAGGTNKPESRTFASLSSRNFRFLWLGVVAMMAGLNMQTVVRGYLTYDLTSSPLRLGLVNSGFAFPMLALALFGGALADRLKKMRIIQVCQGIGSLTSLIVGVSISTGTVTWIHLLIASLTNGLIFAFMVPARTALIAKIVPQDTVSNAFALNAAAMSSTTLIGPAIGGALYAFIGPSGVYYLIAALQFSALVLTGCIRVTDERSARSGDTVIHRIGEGLKYIGRTPLIMWLLVIALATALLVMPFLSLLPVLIVDVFDSGPETLGMMLSVMGGGAIVGSLSIARLGRRNRGAILLAGGLAGGMALLLIGFFPFFGVTVFVMLILGLSDAIRQSLNLALILESTEIEFQGRVSSVYTMNFGLMPLGTLPAAAIAEHFGVPATAVVLATLLLIVCIYVVVKQPALRRIQ